MNRLITLAGVALVFVAMFGLYQLAYRVDAQENRLRALTDQIDREKQATAVLRAEWAYLARPQTIQARAVENLSMMPALPAQMVRFADLPERQQRLIVADAEQDDGSAAEMVATIEGGPVPLPRARPPSSSDASGSGPRVQEPPMPVESAAGIVTADIRIDADRATAAVEAMQRPAIAPTAREPRVLPVSAQPAGSGRAATGGGLLPADMEARLLKLAAQQRSARDAVSGAQPMLTTISASGEGR